MCSMFLFINPSIFIILSIKVSRARQYFGLFAIVIALTQHTAEMVREQIMQSDIYYTYAYTRNYAQVYMDFLWFISILYTYVYVYCIAIYGSGNNGASATTNHNIIIDARTVFSIFYLFSQTARRVPWLLCTMYIVQLVLDAIMFLHLFVFYRHLESLEHVQSIWVCLIMQFHSNWPRRLNGQPLDSYSYFIRCRS